MTSTSAEVVGLEPSARVMSNMNNEKEEKGSCTCSELMTLFILHAASVIQYERINKLLLSWHDMEFDPR